MKKELKKQNRAFGEALYDLAKKHRIKLNNQSSIENILLDAIAPLLEKTMNAEMDEHLGYKKHEKTDFENSRNGYSFKNVRSLFGETKIRTLYDRNGSFEPIIVEKKQSNISKIETAIIKLYAKGTSTRDIVEFIEDTYHFKLGPASISRITDKILPDIKTFQLKTLQKIYAIVFVDGIRFKVREDGITKEVTVYILLGIDLEGKKEVLGYWISESETSKYWLRVFDNMK